MRIVLPRPLALSLPADRAGQARWLDTIEARIGRAVRARLRRIVRAALDAYTATLTAAGDLAELDAIANDWTRYVRETFADDLAGINLHGAMSAWLSTEAVTPAVAESWPSVVNDAAIAYQQRATNRLTQVGDDLWRKVRQQVTTGLANGTNVETVKKQIEQITRFSEFRADTIARTETVSAYVNGAMTGARALGADGPVEKVWIAALDARTRDTHAALHDTCIQIDAMFDVGGTPADAPHAAGLPPGEVVNCRCTVEFLYPGDSRPDGTTIPELDEPAADDD